MKYSIGISNFLEEISSLSYSIVFLYLFIYTDHWKALSLLAILHLNEYVFLFLLWLLLFFFSQLFVTPPQTPILPFFISFSWGWSWSLPPIQCHRLPFIVLQAHCLSDLISWICLSVPLYNHKGFDLGHTWISSGFPYFLQFQSEFGNKEFMIWATVSSWSCFCWLFRASPSLAAKQYNQSDFSVDHLVMSMCKIFSCVIGKECLLWSVRSLGKTLLAFALFHFVLQGQIGLLLQVFLYLPLLHPSPLWWKGYLFWVLVLGLIGLHRTIQLHLQHYWLVHRLGLLWYWMACLGNEQRSFCHFWDCTQVLHFGLFYWLHFF